MLPGFVDSHAHLVFAGDRAAEFAARMAGEPYAAGGIRTTVAATRAATDEQLTAHVARLVAGDAPPGHHHRGDQERLRADRRTTRRAAWRSPGSSPTRRRSSARTSCPDGDDPADYVALVTGPMLEAAAPHARWIDVFCETRRLRRRPGPGRPRRPGSPPGLRAGCTPTSSAPDPGVRLAVELGLPRVDHCTYLSDADVDALARQRHHRDPAARRRVLHPLALPRRPPAARRRRARSRSRPTATPAPATPRRCRCASRSPCARWG